LEALSKAKQKWIRSLHLKKNREAEQVFVVEGEKMVLEGLAIANSELLLLVVHNEHIALIPDTVFDFAFTATSKEMEQLSALSTPNKLIAVFKRTNKSIQANLFTLVLDGIQDPGNMGTILRLADWFGIQQVVCSKDTVDCYNEKVVQASMGAIFRIPVFYTHLPAFLDESSQQKFGAMLNGEHYKSVAYPKDAILIMGNEGKGVRPEVQEYIDVNITIPRYGEAESLNVATATAILLAEMVQ
jgi:TrmH family RNA methyltransferase